MNNHEPEVLARVLEIPPSIEEIVPRSTPVVSFGDPRKARIATLGINPSSNEFIVGNGNASLLSSGEKRLEDLDSLRISSHAEMTEELANKVIEHCYSYFSKTGKPYGWFDELENFVLKPLGYSYFASTACHLDIVQWATDPVWANIKSNKITKKLMENDKEFLKFQITKYSFDYVFLNGSTVVNQVKSLGLVDLEDVSEVTFNSTGTMSKVVTGKAFGTTFVGWGLNIGYGATYEAGKIELSNWLKDNLKFLN